MKGKSLLMIPGPIEFDLDVLDQMGKATTSHVDPEFIDHFGRAIENMRLLFRCKEGQPFVIAGSGTLGMDTAAANLTEPGDRVLQLSTGYFGERMKNIFERYGAEVTLVTAPVGEVQDLNEIETLLKQNQYKIMAMTHVDTSTGVLNRVKDFARLAKKYNVLVVVDGVCSVAAEELRMDDWGVDVAFTASQKAVGVPPGLALAVASKNAMHTFSNRKHPVASYYSDWANWLPIMQAYEARKAAYFGTPAVNLVNALDVSLQKILLEGLDHRLIRHQTVSQAFKGAMQELGLRQIPSGPEIAANTMTAPYLPENVNLGEFLGHVKEAGVVLAGGLLADRKNQYFRVGHMGIVDMEDTMTTIAAIETGLLKCGYLKETGAGTSTAIKIFDQKAK